MHEIQIYIPYKIKNQREREEKKVVVFRRCDYHLI